jgi:glycosyltransferase involved in cell wall biosynthesis
MSLAENRPRVSVVIPTYNRCDMLRDALEHLTLQWLPTSEFEVIVADDGSSDGTRAVVESFSGRLRLKYYFQEDRGFRAAAVRNAGARLASAPLLVFLDTGPLFGPSFLSSHLAVHRDETVRRAVIGYAYGYNPEKDTAWLNAVIRRLGPEVTVAQYAGDPEFRDIRHELLEEVGFDLGRRYNPWQLFFTNNCSVHRDDFWAVGGFDEGFDGWGAEDLELGYRLFLRGLQFEFAPDAWVVDVPHERDLYDLREQLARQMAHFLDLHREPIVEIGWALTVKHLLWSWEDDHRELLAWQQRTRNTSVSTELASAMRRISPHDKIAILGAGSDIPSAIPPALVMDFDKAMVDKATASGRHRGHHTMGLRTPLPARAVDTVIITSRMAGLWDRWGDEILAEAKRISRHVYAADGLPVAAQVSRAVRIPAAVRWTRNYSSRASSDMVSSLTSIHRANNTADLRHGLSRRAIIAYSSPPDNRPEGREVYWGMRRLPSSSLTSADLFGQGDDDARRAAKVAQQEDVLELCHFAKEFGAVGAQAGDGVMDIVNSEHDAMHAQRVGRRVLGLGAVRRGSMVLGQLQLAVAVRSPHHCDLAPDTVESDGAVRPEAFDLSLAFQLHAELGEECHGGVQVVDDDGDVVHPLNAHARQHMATTSRQSGVGGACDSFTARLPGRRGRSRPRYRRRSAGRWPP